MTYAYCLFVVNKLLPLLWLELGTECDPLVVFSSREFEDSFPIVVRYYVIRRLYVSIDIGARL
jgi:hypothetical protein